jgi:GNAT superfamily N-acetyltransferase
MCDEWMPSLRLPLSRREFQELPRHPAYKYEYLDGRAFLSPWPRHRHARLDLASVADTDISPYCRRTLAEDDEARLVDLFAAAFFQVQPFGSLDELTLVRAARQCLKRTFTGGDGPLVPAASFIAHAPDQDRPLGATLITLLPGGDAARREAYEWREPPPSDLWSTGGGQPHLTWVFVSPFDKGQGIGTALLAASARVLREHGYTDLWTTFLVGNDSSTFWHWRNGFEIVPKRALRPAVPLGAP